MGPVDHALLWQLVEGTAALTGQEFFRSLVRSVAQALGVTGVWVTEYLPTDRILRSIAFWFVDHYVDHYEYPIAGSPCEVVIDKAHLIHYPDRVIELFPRDADLPGLRAVSYLGTPLLDPAGAIRGHLAALDDKALDFNPQVETLFRLFAARASSELLRMQAEAELRSSEERLSRLFDSAMDAIVELDEQLNIVRANASCRTLLSARDSELGSLLTPASVERVRRVIGDLEKSDRPYAWIAQGLECLPHHGTPFPAEASVSRFRAGGVRRYGLILRNIADQLETETSQRSIKPPAEDELPEFGSRVQILGRSKPLLSVLSAVRRVAPTMATVLITGETGTGKELVARAIHAASPRAARPLVCINCSAIPAALTESEFFGHEKGAFTGAASRRVGRFELAHGGTIFLDEIGELPLDLQPKLLRVLQEGAFEPVGSSHSRKVDVRVIAATNRNLLAEVKAGRFREDLYYRLNVFPIPVPPLRERGGDVELLAREFVAQHAARMGASEPELTPDGLRRLRSYDWPGNVRELENLIERAVILAEDNRLALADILPEATELRREDREPATKRELRALERDTLMRALENSNWKVAGPDGAAQVLGVPPSTLASRMKALGIRRPEPASHETKSRKIASREKSRARGTAGID